MISYPFLADIVDAFEARGVVFRVMGAQGRSLSKVDNVVFARNGLLKRRFKHMLESEVRLPGL